MLHTANLGAALNVAEHRVLHIERATSNVVEKYEKHKVLIELRVTLHVFA